MVAKDRDTNLPKKYVPKGLSKEDKKKQVKSIKEGTDRPKVDYKTKRSSHIIKFENKHNKKINDFLTFKSLSTYEDIDIVSKLAFSGNSTASASNFLLFDSNSTNSCLLYTSPSPRDRQKSRMPSSA